MHADTRSDGLLLYSLMSLSQCSFVALPAFSDSHSSSIFALDVSLLVLSFMLLSSRDDSPDVPPVSARCSFVLTA